jgi:P450-derived glycosyltransferase activator
VPGGSRTNKEKDSEVSTDDGLGRRLQLSQAIVWTHSAHGDPYATLLRGFEDEVDPLHQQIRARGPLWRSELGNWVTGDYQVGKQLLAHPRFGPRQIDGQPLAQPLHVLPLDEAHLGVDWAEASRLRDFWDPAWCGEAQEWHRAIADEACVRVLAAAGDQFDVALVARQVLVEVVADLFALCHCGRQQLRTVCQAVCIALDSVLCPQQFAATQKLLSAVADIRALIERYVKPDRGIASKVNASVADVRVLALLLAVVGVELAANLVTTTLPALLSDTDLWVALARDPGRVSPVVDEALRYAAPVQIAALVAHDDVQVAGRQIEPGDQVVVLVGAANRDPRVFENPGQFQVGRQVPPLLPGVPHHVVLPFVRTQAAVILQALAGWWPRLRLSGEPLRRNRAPVTRALLQLPVSSH